LPSLALQLLRLHPDFDVRLAAGIADKLKRAKEEAKPLIAFFDLSGGVSLILPFKVYGNILFFSFHGETYATIYDAARVHRIAGIPVVVCLENLLLPVYMQHLVYLHYFEDLARMVRSGLLGMREKIAQQHPEWLQEEKRGGEQGQEDPPDPVNSENPLRQIDGILRLLNSDSLEERLEGVRLGLAALGVDFTPPVTPRILDAYKVSDVTAREFLTYFERWAYGQFAALHGLAQFYGKRIDLGKVLRALLLLGLVLLGAWFALGFLLPSLAATVAPPPAAGVVVP